MTDPIGMARKTRGLAAAAAIMVLTSPALAQSAGTASSGLPLGDSGQAPAREGNIYDHQDHQPTEADAAAAGTAASPATRQQVEKEVDQLLQQTDALDSQAERTGRSDKEIVR